METKNEVNTEQKILEAAELIFQEKGYDGARMQEIADQANINKGLLHYYFKSKDTLFEAIFSMAFRRMINNISNILAMEIPLDEKLDLIIDTYMNMLLRNSSLPRFVINELNKAPDKFIAKHIDGKMNQVFAHFEKTVKKEIAAGRIQNIDPKHLLMNLLSMLVFPFIARPVIQVVVSVNQKEFLTLMNERRIVIKQFVKQALKP